VFGREALGCGAVIIIGVVAEHEVVGVGLACVLAAPGTTVLEPVVGDVRELRRTAGNPDVVVAEAAVLGVNPRRTLSELDGRSLVVCRRLDADRIHALLHAGADGVVGLNAAPESVRDAARAVAHGRRHVPQHLRAAVAEQMLTAPEPRFLRLSDREAQVFEFVAKGWTAQEIADELVLSVSTVRKHMQNGYSKLGVSGRFAAMRVVAPSDPALH
jgi:two-component system, NarL family, response regulator LiaR